jgi:hypothetical protein
MREEKVDKEVRKYCGRGFVCSSSSYFLLNFIRKMYDKKFINSVMSCLSVWGGGEELGSHWMDFRENFYWRVLLKSVDKVKLLLNSDYNKGRLYGNPKAFVKGFLF